MGNFASFIKVLPATRNWTRPATTTYDPLKKSVRIGLSQGNMFASNSSAAGNASVQSVLGKSSGKVYCEWDDIFSQSGGHTGGISDSQFSYNANSLGFDYISYGYLVNGYFRYNTGGGLQQTMGWGSSYGSSVLGMACDFDNNRLWFSVDNVWQNGGNPVAGTGSVGIVADTTYYITCSLTSDPQTDESLLITESANFNYTPPAGFSTWV